MHPLSPPRHENEFESPALAEEPFLNNTYTLTGYSVFNISTAAEVFNGTTRIINEIFVPEYQNKSSIAFKDFETKFINEVFFLGVLNQHLFSVELFLM